MKKTLFLATGLLVLNLATAFAQPSSTFAERLAAIQNRAAADVTNATANLTKFNLDFPGGTPAELVKAIEKAMGKPLNVIISPDEKSAQAQLPPIKVTDMDVARLFRTLLENSRQYDEDHRECLKSTGFFTQDGNPTDNSLWTFRAWEKPSVLTKFNLDFPGGTPAKLAKAIEKVTGKPLNVIISDVDADTKLPPLKMNNVNVATLFQALEQASRKQMLVNISGGYGPIGTPAFTQFNASYGFKTEGQPTDNSVWYFHVDKPVPPLGAPKTCRFYSLSPYLDRGFTVDDITTAIQTGWKLAGETAPPTLNYHKETKLLMAYGEPDKLKTIDDVLKTLPQTEYSLPTLDFNIKKLQERVDELQRKISPSPALDEGTAAEKPAK